MRMFAIVVGVTEFSMAEYVVAHLQQLEKFKFVLDYKIKELKRQIEPRENEISNMRNQIEEMDLELEQVKQGVLASNLVLCNSTLVPGNQVTAVVMDGAAQYCALLPSRRACCC